jgi:hypothetical protein
MRDPSILAARTAGSRSPPTCGPTRWIRLDRLRAALTVAGGVDAPVERGHAAEWIEDRLAQPAGGAVTVVFHSIVVHYLAAAERERFEGALRGAREPLAWLRMEPEGERLASLRLTLWPAGDELLLARVGFHGDPVEWLAAGSRRPAPGR